MLTIFVVSMVEPLVTGQPVKEELAVPSTLTVAFTVGRAAMASATLMPLPATRAKAVKPPFWLSKLLLLSARLTKN